MKLLFCKVKFSLELKLILRKNVLHKSWLKDFNYHCACAVVKKYTLCNSASADVKEEIASKTLHLHAKIIHYTLNQLSYYLFRQFCSFMPEWYHWATILVLLSWCLQKFLKPRVVSVLIKDFWTPPPLKNEHIKWRLLKHLLGPTQKLGAADKWMMVSILGLAAITQASSPSFTYHQVPSNHMISMRTGGVSPDILLIIDISANKFLKIFTNI